MRLIVLLFVSMSSLAMADVKLTPPTAYTDGSPLTIEQIDKFEICVSNVVGGDCTSVIEVSNTSTLVEGIPADTISIKARTVDTMGRKGDYGTVFTDAFIAPLPPGLTFSITLSVEG